jgi:hypothetical protein
MNNDKTTKLENGMYWITNGNMKAVAELQDGRWYLTGSEDYYWDDAKLPFEVISERLEPPQ